MINRAIALEDKSGSCLEAEIENLLLSMEIYLLYDLILHYIFNLFCHLLQILNNVETTICVHTCITAFTMKIILKFYKIKHFSKNHNS